jgi:hypothetical protein
VMSFHASSAVVLAISAVRRSAGNLCTTPPGTRWLLIGPDGSEPEEAISLHHRHASRGSRDRSRGCSAR